MRTDAKIGFAIVGVLLTVVAVYVFVIGKHGKHVVADSGTTTTVKGNEATAPPASDPAAAPELDQVGLPMVRLVPPTPAGVTSPPTVIPPAPAGPGTTTLGTPATGSAVASNAAHPNGVLPDLSGESITVPPRPTDTGSGTAHPREPARRRPAGPGATNADGVIVSAAMHSYRVRQGQTLCSIAAEIYGDSRMWHQIVKDNPGLNPSKLKVGTKIQIPDPAAIRPHPSVVVPAADVVLADEPSVAAVVAGSAYTVRNGDSLYKIAKRYLGSGREADKLYELNRDVIGTDMTRLKPGTALRLPSAASGLLSDAR